MVRCLQITGWQKHRGHHTRWASVRLNTALIVSLFWQSLFLSHNQSQCSLHSHCCDYLHTSYYLPGITSSRKHVKYINSSIFVLLTLKGAVCKVMVILTSWHHCTVLLMFLMIQFSVVCCFSALMLFLGEYFRWCITAAHLVERVNSAWTQEGFSAHVILPPNLTTVLSD